MSEIEDTLKRNQTLIDQGDTRVREAHRVRAEQNRLFESAGLSLEACVAYVNRDNIPAPLKARWDAQETQARERLAAERDRLVMEQRQSAPSPTHRRFVNRQMI